MTLTSPNHTGFDDEIRIYVACLAAYNNGQLHGAWIDATQDLDDIMAEVQEMLKASPQPDAEEYALHDYEGFGGIRLSEWTGLEQAHEYAVFVQDHGELGAKLLDHVGDLENTQAVLSDGYAGCYDTLAVFAEEFTDGMTEIPECLVYYIDYERMANDMEMNGEVFTIETAHDEVHVFWVR